MSGGILGENWSAIQVDAKNYSVKCLFDRSSFELVLLDLKGFKLYHLKQDESQILELFKELNKSLDVPFPRILAHLKDCLLGQNDPSAKFTETETTGSSPKKHGAAAGPPHIIALQSKLAGFKFNWQFKFVELPAASWSQHVVVPLLLNIAEYQLREGELIKLIQNKDKELEDYRSQGFKLTRKYLHTESFNPETFDASMLERQETVSFLKSPEKCLYSESFRAVNKIRVSKSETTASGTQSSSIEPSPAKPTKSEKTAKKASSAEPDEETASSQEVKKETTSRREELLQTLSEEAMRNEKKQSQKKKKLF